MKELAYLMFFIGCGYALNLAFVAISDKDSRKLYITYPSNSCFNLLWGFLFYAGFACLTIKNIYIQFILIITILGLILALIHNYLLRSCLQNSGQGIYKKILQKKFLRQANEDSIKNMSYTESEISKILGLPQNISPNNTLVSNRLQIFANLAKNNTLPYAPNFYQKIETFIKTK